MDRCCGKDDSRIRAATTTGTASNPAASRLAAEDLCVAGSCAHPAEHFGEAIQTGPAGLTLLACLRQQQTFDRLQQGMPQVASSAACNW